MSTRIRTTATVLAGIAAGTVIVLTGTPAPATAPVADDPSRATETMVLAFPWLGGDQRFIDRGKKGISPGDLFL